MRDLQKDLEIIRAATPGNWDLLPAVCGPEGQGVYQEESGGCICEVGDPYPRGDNHPQENMTFIVEAHNGGWEEAIKRAMAAEARVKELEAQAAAMRKVIEETIPEIIIAVNQTNEEIFPIWKNRRIPALEAVIANDAGRDMLERLEKLETQHSAILQARECINRAYHDVDHYTMPQTASPNAQLLEDAIKELREAARILDAVKGA